MPSKLHFEGGDSGYGSGEAQSICPVIFEHSRNSRKTGSFLQRQSGRGARDIPGLRPLFLCLFQRFLKGDFFVKIRGKMAFFADLQKSPPHFCRRAKKQNAGKARQAAIFRHFVLQKSPPPFLQKMGDFLYFFAIEKARKRRQVAKKRGLQKSILFCKPRWTIFTKFLLGNLLYFLPFHKTYSCVMTKT